MLADAYMDEIVRTTFAITDVLKGMAFDARMDCYVQHGDTLRHTATAQILHGYAISDGPDAGRLTVLDPPIVSALTNGYAPCD